MVRRFSLAIVVALLLATFGTFWIGTPARAADQSYTIKDNDLFVYVPSDAALFQPVQVLVALHGMGGNGQSFSQELLSTAERNGWIVVAPTVKYQDYKNPALVLQDDVTSLPRLKVTLDALPKRLGIATREKVLLYGHSRGSQAAQRFATFYPEQVLGVAALSAGSYTLPLKTMLVNGRSRTLPLPYGVADMRTHLGRDFNYEAFRRIPFRISVGQRDNNPDQTPSAWDPYLGRNRVERATSYTKVLRDIGMKGTLLIVYPGAGHNVTPQMQAEALAFLRQVVAQNALQFGAGPARGVLSYGAVVDLTATKAR